jgi:hypothetical protein
MPQKLPVMAISKVNRFLPKALYCTNGHVKARAVLSEESSQRTFTTVLCHIEKCSTGQAGQAMAWRHRGPCGEIDTAYIDHMTQVEYLWDG